MFNFPRGLCYAQVILFIADTGNHCVRTLTKDGIVSTIVGNGDVGDADGPQEASMMNKPTSVAYSKGILYIADSFNNKIKMLAVE